MDDNGKATSRIEWREVAQFDGGEVIFKDNVEGDEMCPHFRQATPKPETRNPKPET
jgi:hypothetical protein